MYKQRCCCAFPENCSGPTDLPVDLRRIRSLTKDVIYFSPSPLAAPLTYLRKAAGGWVAHSLWFLGSTLCIFSAGWVNPPSVAYGCQDLQLFSDASVGTGMKKQADTLQKLQLLWLTSLGQEVP